METKDYRQTKRKLELTLESLEDQIILIKDDIIFRDLYSQYLLLRCFYRYYLNSERSEDYIETFSEGKTLKQPRFIPKI